MNGLNIRSPRNNEMDEYFNVRYIILRAPWKQPNGSEKDNNEKTAIHAAAFFNNKIVGVGRLQKLNNSTGQIRYMGVLNEFSGQGIGKKIMDFLEEKAKHEQLTKIILNARENAVPFYKKCGYTVHKKSYLLWDTIQHYEMIKVL